MDGAVVAHAGCKWHRLGVHMTAANGSTGRSELQMPVSIGISQVYRYRPKQSLHMPAANDMCRGCTCRLQMTCAGAADANCKWPEQGMQNCWLQIALAGDTDAGCKWHLPRVQMPAANGLSRECRTTDADCRSELHMPVSIGIRQVCRYRLRMA